MRFTPFLRTASLAGAVCVLGGVACGESRSAAGRVNPTYLEVDPAEFVSEGACATSPGGLRWYVATLVDVTPDSEGRPANFRLPSSPPTACSKSVFFSGVVARGSSLGVAHDAHQYVAELEAYDAEALKPLHEGSSVMTRNGVTVLPGWVGSCGSDASELASLLGVDAGASERKAGFEAHFAGPVSPFPGRTVTFRSCELVRIGEPSNEARVTVSLANVLGDLACGERAGEVATFEVALGDEVKRARCGSEVTFDGLEAGVFLEFDVVAEGAVLADAGADAGSGSARWTTTCYQEPVSGQQLTARCDPLVEDQ